MNMSLPILHPTLTAHPKTYWNGLPGSSKALAISNLMNIESLIVIITDDLVQAYQYKDALEFFLKGSTHKKQVFLFPDWEILPYDMLSPHIDILSDRIQLLHQLPALKHAIIIISITTLMHRLAPPSYIQSHSFMLTKGDTVDLNQFIHQLLKVGYQHVSQVLEHGEFVVRGGIVDVFPMGSPHPYRLEFFDDKLESLRTFDVETQLSREALEHIHLLPAHEYDLSEPFIQQFQFNWRQIFKGNPKNCQVFQSVSKGIAPAGIEYYLPLFFEKSATFFDFLPQQALLVTQDTFENAGLKFWKETTERYHQYVCDPTRFLLEPNQIIIPLHELTKYCQDFKSICISEQNNTSKGISFHCEKIKPHVDGYKPQNPFDTFKPLLTHESERLFIVAETLGRREMLLNLLHANHHEPSLHDSWASFLKSSDKIGLSIGFLPHGFRIPHVTSIITEAELFNYTPSKQRHRKIKVIDHEKIIKSLIELTPNAPVVHTQYGVGLYKGLCTLTTNQVASEFIMLEYADGDKIYVPVTSLHLINRYTGLENDHVKLAKLGTDTWSRVKEKVLKQIHDTACELLEIYAKRETKHGTKFIVDEASLAHFAQQFPFDETPDQEKAIEAIQSDLANEKPMDRLICGDVGFGKTEVAMRAAFIVVQNKKQVAILVPTTLLAMQHYQTFVDRFAGFNINIEALTRFQNPKKTNHILETIKDGRTQIIIGTHKLLTSNIPFHDLGLLIIDEEHRFGVKQKEFFKSKRSEVDILTLTATPIPRTLNLALSGLRDISIIATPPARRLAIKTFIVPYNKVIIKEAILREMVRGGQVFYLHNNIKTIQRTYDELKSLLPQASIAIAHGQMREQQLETIMNDFYHNRYHILLCTTIIESGIDIPTANTIIIDRADKFGLAQLHQLRGRVGRSHHQAYAYLLKPSEEYLTEDAKKRLQAVETLGNLGSGFMLSTHDLEIRGAGEILGEEQSGSIAAIGFSFYMELLERTIEALKKNKHLQQFDPIKTCEVNIHLPAYIPEAYIGDAQQRLILYKRIANTKTKDELDKLKVEMIDRFGLLPMEIKYLFLATEIKQICEKIGIKKFNLSTKGGIVEFIEHPPIDIQKILSLIQNFPKQYRFKSSTQIQISQHSDTVPERIRIINHFFKHINNEMIDPIY